MAQILNIWDLDKVGLRWKCIDSYDHALVTFFRERYHSIGFIIIWKENKWEGKQREREREEQE